jgi:hypothetical protein
VKLSDLSERFIVYIAEQSFLISLTSLVALSLNIKAAFLGFFITYKVDFIEGFSPIFNTYYGLYNLLILFTLSLLYYSIESLTNHGIAEDIFKLKIINKYDIDDNKLLRMLLLRDVIKAFFISNVINSLFIIKYSKLLQNYYDHKFNLISIKYEVESKKSLFFQYFYSSLVMYYSIFLILLVIYTFVVPASSLAISGTKANPSFHFWNFFETIFNNNLTLDIFEYIIGGFSLFTGTFIELFSSNIYETIIMASLDSTYGLSSFVKYMLPQFFPETLGYVFGIAISMTITDIMLSYLQSMARNQKYEYFFKRTKELLVNAGYYFTLSIILLVVGAIVEASLGVLNF